MWITHPHRFEKKNTISCGTFPAEHGSDRKIQQKTALPEFFRFCAPLFLFRGCSSSVSFLTLSFCLRDSASLHCTFGTLFKSFSRDHSVFSPRRLPSVLVLRREPAPESFTSSVVHLSKIKFPKALRTFSKNFYVFFYFCKTIAPVIGFVNTPCRIFFGILQKYIKKNPASQDSPPAAGRFSDIIPLRRSAILPGGLFNSQENSTKFPVN